VHSDCSQIQAAGAEKIKMFLRTTGGQANYYEFESFGSRLSWPERVCQYFSLPTADPF